MLTKYYNRSTTKIEKYRDISKRCSGTNSLKVPSVTKNKSISNSTKHLYLYRESIYRESIYRINYKNWYIFITLTHIGSIKSTVHNITHT